jgi:hypothetical protein
MPEHDEATLAVTAIWKILLGLREPHHADDVLASAVVSWADAVSGADVGARAAALDAFTDAVSRELEERAAARAGHV